MTERDELTSVASDNTAEEGRVRRAAFRLVLEGSAVSMKRLAQETGMQEHAVQQAVQALRDRGLVTTR